jgi:hypothetical protein
MRCPLLHINIPIVYFSEKVEVAEIIVCQEDCENKRKRKRSLIRREKITFRSSRVFEHCRRFSKKSRRQGDQMSFEKNRPKCSPTHFLPKWIQNFFLIKKVTQLLNKVSICTSNLVPLVSAFTASSIVREE